MWIMDGGLIEEKIAQLLGISKMDILGNTGHNYISPGVARDGDWIYIYGGSPNFAGSSNVSTFNRININTLEVETLPSVGVSLGTPATCFYAGKFWMWGGRYGSSYSNTLRSYDPVSQTWLSHGDIGTRKICGGSILIGSKLYRPGGYSAGYLATFDCVDLDTLSLSTLPNLPRAISTGPSALSAEGDIYIVGGNIAGGVGNETYCFEIANNRWVQKRSTIATSGQNVVSIGNHIYSIGGWSGTSYVPGARRYDPATDLWEYVPIEGLSQLRYGTAIALPDRILSVGGYYNGDLGRIVSFT